VRVRRVTITHRRGRPYLFLSADFDDVNRLRGSAAFSDLDLRLARRAGRLVLDGTWKRPAGAPQIPASDGDGLMAVRLHLPSKVYEHKNAVEGVERGNIVAWRQDVSQALAGAPLEFGAVMDQRSILGSTVALFAGAITLALGLLGLGFYLALRRGRRQRAQAG
jgi:hypothetical protein